VTVTVPELAMEEAAMDEATTEARFDAPGERGPEASAETPPEAGPVASAEPLAPEAAAEATDAA